MPKNPVTLIRRLAAAAAIIAVVAGGSLAGGIAPAEAAAKPVAIVNKSLPTIKGTAKVGSTLTGTLGTWTGSPKLVAQWIVCPKPNVTLKTSSACSAVAAQGQTKYKVRSSDIGRYLVFAVAGIKGPKYVFAFSKSTKKIPGDATPVAPPNNFSFNNGIRLGTNLQAFTSTNTPTTADVPVVSIYLDFQCPFCKQALEGPLSAVDSNASSGQWIVEYHPISFLDGAGTNKYSSRAANAAVCVGSQEPDKFAAFSDLLFANQPEEGTAGPVDSDLIAYAAKVGVQDAEAISACITGQKYASWVAASTDAALSKNLPGTKKPLQGTPTVMVKGVLWPNNFGTADDFAAWVASVSG